MKACDTAAQGPYVTNAMFYIPFAKSSLSTPFSLYETIFVREVVGMNETSLRTLWRADLTRRKIDCKFH